MEYDNPIRDARRIQTLRSYSVLDTESEAAFDEIVSLVASICDKPVALISLVDEERQWFKAELGFGRRETPLDQSICAKVMFADDVVIIKDTLLDPRSRDNPLCTGMPHMRFYAGAPLTAPNGEILGTLCVLDDKPGDLTQLQRDTLVVLANQVMAQLNLRRALRRADILRREVDHRVKNSLQTVSSLARMQAKRVSGAEAREALEVVGRRIETVAALNSELYRSESVEQIALQPFLETVVSLISDGGPDNVKLGLKVDDVSVTSAAAGSIAIIVNEFATNSFKHAFPDGQTGTIEFTGRQIRPGQFQLVCADDGIGVDQEATDNGLGMTIISSAVDQLDGRMERRAGTGYVLDIRFPL